MMGTLFQKHEKALYSTTVMEQHNPVLPFRSILLVLSYDSDPAVSTSLLCKSGFFPQTSRRSLAAQVHAIY